MYRINLYPTGLARRADRAAAVRSTLFLAILGGANLVVLGFFFLVSNSLRTRAELTDARATSLQQRLTRTAAAGSRALSNQARMLVERRAARVTWTPALEELRAALPPDLIVERLEATVSKSDEAFSGLQISGRLRAGRNVDPVVDFINRLSSRPAYRQRFAAGKLERVDNSTEVSRFVIACPLARSAESDSTAEGNDG